MTQVLFEKCTTEKEKYAILSLLICKVTENQDVYDSLKSWVLNIQNETNQGKCDMLQYVELLYQNLISNIHNFETKQVNAVRKESYNETTLFDTKSYSKDGVTNACVVNTSNCFTKKDSCMTLTVSPKPIRVLVDGVFDLVHSGNKLLVLFFYFIIF
jgi:hypothetical protein